MDDFKKEIKGYRGRGYTCPCCTETDKEHSRKLARRRLRQTDQRAFREVVAARRGEEGE